MSAIHSTGFYHNKAKNIIACCKTLMEKYQGEIPRELDALTGLAGVGRKTANVIRGVTIQNLIPQGILRSKIQRL